MGHGSPERSAPSCRSCSMGHVVLPELELMVPGAGVEHGKPATEGAVHRTAATVPSNCLQTWSAK